MCAYGVNRNTTIIYAPFTVNYTFNQGVVENIIAQSTEPEPANEMKKEMDKVAESQVKDTITLQFITDALAENPFVIEADEVQTLLTLTKLTLVELMPKLIPKIQTLALPPISNYHVGAVGLGRSGKIYLGVNLEFLNYPLNQAIHGEQFLVVNARLHGETELTHMALSAAPCGHCRQFLMELGEKAASNLTILTPNKPPKQLTELLPDAFGPQDLGLEGGLLAPSQPFTSKNPNRLEARAVEAAHTSYTPYSQSLSGVAIETRDGSIYSGAALENAAYNPSISPLHSALVALLVARKKYTDIVQVVLAESKTGKVSHATITGANLKLIAPTAQFRTIDSAET